MTVERLIEELKKFPAHYEVMCVNDNQIFCLIGNIEKNDHEEEENV